MKAATRLAAALATLSLSAACGSRSSLDVFDGAGGRTAAGTGGEAASGGGTGGGGTGGAGGAGGAPCGNAGATCVISADCCDLPCVKGVCAPLPPPCAADTAPVLLAEGLTDPYSLGANATSLFVGQLETGKQLLRFPKAGGAPTVLIDDVDFVEFITVEDETVYFSSESAVNAIPTSGGSPKVMTKAFGPAGFALTKPTLYLAEYLAQDLVAVDRATLDEDVLASDLPGIYRVAASGDDVYFSAFGDGLRRYRVPTGELSVLAPEVGSPRALLAYHDVLYFTVPNKQRIYRLPAGAESPELVADLGALGSFIEALATDGQFLYTTVIVLSAHGHVARVPISGGAPEIIADGGGPQPSALVVDDACVYWTERNGGSLYRARKTPAPAP